MVPLLEIIRSTFVLDRLQNTTSSYPLLFFPSPLSLNKYFDEVSYHALPFPLSQRVMIKSTLRDLCGAMKDKAVDLVNGFGVPDFLLGEIGNDWLACNAEPLSV